MKTNSGTTALVASLAFLSIGRASAHIGYGGRDFGSYLGTPQSNPASISITNISSDFGWAAATDANFGDSHRTRAFRFNLASPGTVILTVQGGPGLLPGVSLYGGLGHLAPVQGSHDAAALSQQYLAGLSGPTKMGALNALDDWAIGNDPTYTIPDDPLSGVLYAASLRYFDYIGNVADGTSTNYGSASGINGDGNADGFITATFNLPAGDYSFFLGGANLASESPGPTWTNYGATVSLTVIPEPSCAALAALSCALLFRRKR
ncbi:MAG: PEP-CTERM sorting domain-containing protein [Luteolibacter sp.]|uniref:PEP-CTERM sorting domain-containing protein n=1 Tax=Luteolibacter sp. TaxID=1962973 RepID=UPI00326680DC